MNTFMNVRFCQLSTGISLYIRLYLRLHIRLASLQLDTKSDMFALPHHRALLSRLIPVRSRKSDQELRRVTTWGFSSILECHLLPDIYIRLLSSRSSYSHDVTTSLVNEALICVIHELVGIVSPGVEPRLPRYRRNHTCVPCLCF